MVNAHRPTVAADVMCSEADTAEGPPDFGPVRRAKGDAGALRMEPIRRSPQRYTRLTASRVRAASSFASFSRNRQVGKVGTSVATNVHLDPAFGSAASTWPLIDLRRTVLGDVGSLRKQIRCDSYLHVV